MSTQLPRRKPRPGKGERLLRSLFISALCWPQEALFVMWGLHLLKHEGFNVPTPGYVSCFLVALALSLLWSAATMSTEVRKSIEADER